jgi:hypothetical protein
MHGVLLVIIYLSLLGIPFFAFFTSIAVQNLKRLLLVAASVMAIISLAMTLDIHWVWQPLNVLSWAAWYLGYCLLVFSLLRLKPRWLGRMLTFILTLPMLALAIVSVMAGLVVLFIIDDMVPKHRQAQDGLVCTVYTSGNATTRYNYHNAHLTKPLPLLPVLEHRREIKRIMDEGQSLEESCQQVFHALHKRPEGEI